MEVTKKVMNESFSRLHLRLYDIKNNKLSPESEKATPYVFQHSISDIKEVIFSADFEDAQDFLNYSIGEIDSVISQLPTISNSITFKDYYHGSIFESTEFTSAENEKKNFENYLLEELKYYRTELDTLNQEVIEKANTLGDLNYTNAGMKIGLNLTVEEIGYFFNLLFENGLIIDKASDAKDITKKELARFITKNFKSQKGKNISLDNMVNSLSFKNKKTESSILTLLEKLILKVDEYNT